MINLQNPEPFLEHLETQLHSAPDADFWKTMLMEATAVILSVLKELDQQALLFTPEGKPLEQINLSELVRWYDLVNLKTLAFILDQSNQKNALCRTAYALDQAQTYTPISLDRLADHLQKYGITLDDETKDFPNRFYVQHYELGQMLTRLL